MTNAILSKFIKINVIGLLTLVMGLFSGCASQGFVIGKVPSEPAPQIVFLGAKDAKNNDYLTWENVSSFGQVPADLQANGDLSCMSVHIELRATGYHPKALDRSGKLIPGGGFYCQATLLTGFNKTPPRLVNKDGILGWDRPSAFGVIPTNLVGKGQAECSRQNAKLRAIAYHPNALDQNGNLIPEGGFLCTY